MAMTNPVEKDAIVPSTDRDGKVSFHILRCIPVLRKGLLGDSANRTIYKGVLFLRCLNFEIVDSRTNDY
jgi:hypothetical protein